MKRRRSEESGRKIRSDALAEEEIKVVEDFFNRDDMSRICPGKKDFLSVKTSEGRELRQKRLLLMNVNEAYELFKKEEPGLKIGRSKFASLRPHQVMPMSLHNQEVCMCKYHENINMILDGLKNILPKCLGTVKISSSKQSAVSTKLSAWIENVKHVELPNHWMSCLKVLMRTLQHSISSG